MGRDSILSTQVPYTQAGWENRLAPLAQNPAQLATKTANSRPICEWSSPPGQHSLKPTDKPCSQSFGRPQRGLAGDLLSHFNRRLPRGKPQHATRDAETAQDPSFAPWTIRSHLLSDRAVDVMREVSRGRAAVANA